MKGFVLAGTHSGVGKTTVTLGVMRALCNRGIRIAPFKVGPDYIDPMFHRIAANAPSYNLDLVLMGQDGIERTFQKKSRGRDLSIVEGVMGLYDGLNFERNNGSSAHLARILNLPVFLIVDAHGMAASVVAHIRGFVEYEPDLNIAGVILNRVSSKSLFEYLKAPIEEKLEVPCVGFLEKDPAMRLESRHLGLVPVNELANFERQLNVIADRVEKNFDWKRFDELIPVQPEPTGENRNLEQWAKGLKIAIAKDDAFNFYYQENLDLIEAMGGEWITCSPLKDSMLPEDIDALYLGGGFPEIFAEELIGNTDFVEDLAKKISAGLPVYAECGGYIYLSKSIKQLDGRVMPMMGILPGEAEMTKKLQRFGYVSCDWGEGTVPGHEFHRSKIVHAKPVQQKFHVSLLRNPNKQWKCGERQGNIFAGYPHLHFTNHPELLKEMMDRIYRERTKKDVYEES